MNADRSTDPYQSPQLAIPAYLVGSRQPAVLTWYIVYCATVSLLCLAYICLLVVTFVGGGKQEQGWAIIFGVMVLPFFVLHALPLFLQPIKASWTYGLVVIAFGFATCFFPFAIPLLIYWLKPEVKAYLQQPGAISEPHVSRQLEPKSSNLFADTTHPPQSTPTPPISPPSSRRPAVVVWYSLYCAVMSLAFFGWTGSLIYGYLDTPPYARHIEQILAVVISIPLVLIYSAAPLLPRTKFTWNYVLLTIALGFMTGCAIPVSVPLFIYWLTPEVKAYMNCNDSAS